MGEVGPPDDRISPKFASTVRDDPSICTLDVKRRSVTVKASGGGACSLPKVDVAKRAASSVRQLRAFCVKLFE